MKKIIIALFVLIGLTNIINAGSETSGYNDVITSNTFNFEAKLENGKVYTKWQVFSKDDGETFKYYKVVRSSNNSNPAYPEDGYIKYSTETNFTSYTDEKPSIGNNYYRICAIYEKNRYCSNVVNIKIESNKNPNTEIKNSIPPQKPKNNEKFDKIIEKFDKMLNEKNLDSNKKIEKIDLVISRLNTLKSNKTYLSDTINYLIKKLEELKAKYSDSEIENIFNIE